MGLDALPQDQTLTPDPASPRVHAASPSGGLLGSVKVTALGQRHGIRQPQSVGELFWDSGWLFLPLMSCFQSHS